MGIIEPYEPWKHRMQSYLVNIQLPQKKPSWLFYILALLTMTVLSLVIYPLSFMAVLLITGAVVAGINVKLIEYDRFYVPSIKDNAHQFRYLFVRKTMRVSQELRGVVNNEVGKENAKYREVVGEYFDFMRDCDERDKMVEKYIDNLVKEHIAWGKMTNSVRRKQLRELIDEEYLNELAKARRDLK